MTSPADEVAKPEQALPSTHLSTISKKYDTSGKGYLDENERKMRELDTSNRGYLTNDRVHDMMKEMNKKVGVVVLVYFSSVTVGWKSTFNSNALSLILFEHDLADGHHAQAHHWSGRLRRPPVAGQRRYFL